jgi:hypothetical protein
LRETPGNAASKTIKPANAGDSASSQILFVVFNTIRFQKFYELVSERFFLLNSWGSAFGSTPGSILPPAPQAENANIHLAQKCG